MRLEDFENPISGKTDSVFKASTWWSYILGFAVMVVSFGIAAWLVGMFNGWFGGLAGKLPVLNSIPGVSTQPKPAAGGQGGGLVVLQ